MDEYYAAIRRLPGFLRRPLEDLSPRQAQTIHEIHLRSGRPVVLTCAGGQFCLPGPGRGAGRAGADPRSAAGVLLFLV